MGSSCSSNKAHEIKKTTQVPGLKIAVVGDCEVGKSCVLDRYINNLYSPLYIPTRKVDLRSIVRKVNVPGHATVPVTFWDIPGHEDLDIHQSYFRNLDAVIVVVDASVSSSIESCKPWRWCVVENATFTTQEDSSEKRDEKKSDAIESSVDPEDHDATPTCKTVDNLPFLLLGNKKDLISHGVPAPDNGEIIRTGKDEGQEEGMTNLKVSSSSETSQRMEEAAADGFVGSVLVSAKSNDLSIHGAIQSFLRHILEKHYVDRRWRAVEKTPKVKRQRYEFAQQMQSVGIDKIDEEFSKADEIAHRVKSLHRYQEDSLAKFAAQCVDIDVIDSTKNASMQNCLVALRNKLDSLDLKLKLVLMDDFYTLEVKAGVADAELETNLRYALKTFNKEYVAVTMAMLKEYPLAEEKLEKIDQKVDALCLQFNVPATSDPSHVITTSDLHRKGVAVERNRARVRHVIHECRDCLAAVQTSVKQVKTAFVW